MRSRLGLLIAGMLLVGLPGMRASAAPVHQSTGGTILYNWKFPQKGHAHSWTFAGGTVTYTGESNDALFPHFQLNHRADFAVQATIRALGAGGPQMNVVGYGLVTRQSAGAVHTSVAGGSFFSVNSEDNNPELYWNGVTVGGAAFDPGKAWHVYRLEVHGNGYTLFIDGKQMVQYTIADYPFPAAVGIFSRFYKIAVKDFQVMALGPASTPAPVYPSLEPLDLTLADLPTTTFFAPIVRHFYPNDETARERGVTLASLQSSGRLVSYGIDFDPQAADFLDLYSSVTVFQTAAEAQADLPARLASFKDLYSSYQNYRALPSNQVGDSSGGFSFDYTVEGTTATVAVIYFVRGAYTGLIRLAVLTDSMSYDQLLSTALGLAKILDGHIALAH